VASNHIFLAPAALLTKSATTWMALEC